MECSHSQTSQTLGTLQTQSHCTFLSSWNAATHKPHKHWGLYRLSLTVHF